MSFTPILALNLTLLGPIDKEQNIILSLGNIIRKNGRYAIDAPLANLDLKTLVRIHRPAIT